VEHCDIGLCPLEDTEFNRFKSPLKLLETAGLGLPAVVSEHPVYFATARQMPSAQLAATEPASWVAALEELYARRDGLEAEGRALQDWAMTHVALTEDIDDLLQQHFARRPATGFAPKIVESA